MGYNGGMGRSFKPPGARYAEQLAGRVSAKVADGMSASTRWLADRRDALNTAGVAEIFLAGVDKAAESRWEAAVERAAGLPGTIRPEKVEALTRSFARELGAVGAASGVAAAAPGIGTGTRMVTATAELGWFTARSGDLVLTMAALHGRDTPTVEERRAWVLAVLIFGGSARDAFASTAKQFGLDLEVPGGRVPVATLQAINGTLASGLLRRYGARRGAATLGSLLPLGIGALIGGTANYGAARALARHADQFFARLPYSAIDAAARG